MIGETVMATKGRSADRHTHTPYSKRKGRGGKIDRPWQMA